MGDTSIDGAPVRLFAFTSNQAAYKTQSNEEEIVVMSWAHCLMLGNDLERTVHSHDMEGTTKN